MAIAGWKTRAMIHVYAGRDPSPPSGRAGRTPCCRRETGFSCTGIVVPVAGITGMSDSHKLRGSIGGLTRAATAPTRQEITQAARDRQWQQFLDQVPPEITDEAERQRRAELLRKAYMRKLALKASAARSKAARARRSGDAA